MAAALAALAALVTAGTLATIDQYAINHWMPDFQPSSGLGGTTIAGQLYPHLGSPLNAFCNLWTFPASPFCSGLLVAICCVALVRRGRPVAAAAWAGAWVVGNLAEEAGKHFLHRPPLHALVHGMRVSFDGFGHSFPSGHAIRAVITAAVVVAVWRRFALPALVWTLVALVALVVGAFHTPSDVVGGVLVALLTIRGAQAVVRERELVA
jgi:membrane-associated phospholipid phosphatase